MNPCSTHSICVRTKISVIFNAAELFNLSENECEVLANKAGISLFYDENISLESILKNLHIKTGKIVHSASVSERMFQYYLKGKKPTKQALLAIFISLNFSASEMDTTLRKLGYCLSKSLPNDIITLYFLNNFYNKQNGVLTLNLINEVLERLDLPLLMTKIINR